MKRYISRKVAIYLLTFFVAITLNWLIPRMMPGDPIVSLVSRLSRQATNNELVYQELTEYYGFNEPAIVQYGKYLWQLAQGDLGTSIQFYPTPVSQVIGNALPYSLVLTIPALVFSFLLGNRLGALAARNKRLDNSILPMSYLMSSIPYLFLGLMLSWILASNLNLFPLSGAYSFSRLPSFTIPFILNTIHHWLLPFLSLFLVQLGGWAIGMRNLIIYELENEYARYLRTLGAPNRLVRKYAYNNARLPQVTGLATQLGLILIGNITVEHLFGYPGIGSVLVQGIMSQDYFVVQGGFLYVVLFVLIANFTIDILYMFIDPRVRYSMAGD